MHSNNVPYNLGAQPTTSCQPCFTHQYFNDRNLIWQTPFTLIIDILVAVQWSDARAIDHIARAISRAIYTTYSPEWFSAEFWRTMLIGTLKSAEELLYSIYGRIIHW